MKAKMSPFLVCTTWLCLGMMLLGGCSHPLAIKNLDSYRAHGVTSLDKPLRIGIASTVSEPEQRRLLDGVANALGGSSAQIVMPYAPNSTKEVDVVATIDIEANHKGSGWNFLINWPGFLVWAPAWNGYIYEVKYTIDCTLTKGGTREAIDQFQIPIVLDVRHAAINRTWTELSWLEVSAIAFVGGIVFVNYDESVTPLVVEKIETPLGKFIAQEIVKRINGSGKFAHIDQRDSLRALAEASLFTPIPQG
jgi:hypothetical protein